jgi:hypothetical protein
MKNTDKDNFNKKDKNTGVGSDMRPDIEKEGLNIHHENDIQRNKDFNEK